MTSGGQSAGRGNDYVQVLLYFNETMDIYVSHGKTVV